jgi:prepilin-type N-terminal cleavage/methylation domain-containing protein
MLYKKQKGFTLLELLVVIAIVGVLASVVVASLNSGRVKARNAAVLAQMDEYRKALELYRAENDMYPHPNGSNPALRTREVCFGDGFVTPCFTGATHSGASINTALSKYLSSLPRFVLDPTVSFPALSGCKGQGFNDNDFDNDGVNDCSVRDYSLFFFLEGQNQNCGKSYMSNGNFAGKYTLCRMMP